MMQQLLLNIKSRFAFTCKAAFLSGVLTCLIVPKQDSDADAAVAGIERVVRVVGGGVGHPFNAGKSIAFDAAFFD